MDRERSIGKGIIVLANRIHRIMDKEVAHYGITGIQSRILGFIYRNSDKRDIFQKDIEEEFDIRRSSVTSVLQLMEKNGFIERVSVSEDARLKKLIITDKGLETHKSVRDFTLTIEKSFREELSDEEADMLINLVERLIKKVDD